MEPKQQQIHINLVIHKIKNLMPKLTDDDYALYADGKRPQFLSILQTKYYFTGEKAEIFLSGIECNSKFPPI